MPDLNEKPRLFCRCHTTHTIDSNGGPPIAWTWRMHDCPLHGIGTEHWKPSK